MYTLHTNEMKHCESQQDDTQRTATMQHIVTAALLPAAITVAKQLRQSLAFKV